MLVLTHHHKLAVQAHQWLPGVAEYRAPAPERLGDYATKPMSDLCVCVFLSARILRVRVASLLRLFLALRLPPVSRSRLSPLRSYSKMRGLTLTALRVA